MNDSTPILKQLIQIKTENPPGNTKKIIYWIDKWAKKEGISSQIHWYEEERGNIQLTIGKSDKTVLICGHLDTVPVGDLKNWNTDPFGGEEEKGYIYGRGAADMKAGVSIALSALKRIKDKFNISEMKYSITFLGTSDEEVGLGGAKASLELNLLNQTEFLIIPEPTALKIGISEKGVLWVSIIASGQAAHGSTPEKGINAIEELVKLFPVLHSSITNHHDEILGKSTLNIGVIQGGNLANVVPERAEVQCDFRLVPPYQSHEFSKTLVHLVKEFGNESPADFEVKIRQSLPSIESDKNNFYVKRFVQISGNQPFSGLNYATDGAVLVSNAPKNLPFIIFGPGNPNKIHVSNERVSINELELAEDILFDFLATTCFSNAIAD